MDTHGRTTDYLKLKANFMWLMICFANLILQFNLKYTNSQFFFKKKKHRKQS